ncbi:MAG TPA: FecR domain-containing protein [Rhizomicrobium sp.]|jgi:transmembrane sensor
MNTSDQKLAAETNAQAASWLRRHQLGQWSEADDTALNDWLQQDIVNRVAYWRLKAAWGRADRLAALRRDNAAPPASKTSSRMLKIAAGAAAIAIAGVGANFWLRAAQPQDAVYATALGERKTIALTDGSEIDLNTNTSIRFQSAANVKTVTLLKGEAYFQIKHDPKRLFVIKADGHRITDIGTKFRVRRDDARLEVSLLEGEVRFDSADARVKPLSLKPGDVVIATAHSAAVMEQPRREIADTLGWRNGMIVFKHTTLAEAAAEFNRYNAKKVVIADADAAKLTINGTFQTGDITAFADAAHAVFGLHVVSRNGETVISH